MPLHSNLHPTTISILHKTQTNNSSTHHQNKLSPLDIKKLASVVNNPTNHTNSLSSKTNNQLNSRSHHVINKHQSLISHTSSSENSQNDSVGLNSSLQSQHLPVSERQTNQAPSHLSSQHSQNPSQQKISHRDINHNLLYHDSTNNSSKNLSNTANIIQNHQNKILLESSNLQKRISTASNTSNRSTTNHALNVPQIQNSSSTPPTTTLPFDNNKENLPSRETTSTTNNTSSSSHSSSFLSKVPRAFLNENKSRHQSNKLSFLPQIKQLNAPSKQLLLNTQEVLDDTKSTLDGLILYECSSSIDRKPTIIEETSPIVLRYKTPYFRANATILLPPIEKKHTWTIGWIQACEKMKFVNKYGKLGESGWEIPQLESKLVTAVSDSDGISYPWYGNSSEIATICGPTKHHKKVVVRMNDNFYPSVTWDIPVSEKDQSRLTKVERDQNFVTWLAALNENTGELIVLRTIRWKFKIIIEVDPDQPLGNRATLLHNHCDYLDENQHQLLQSYSQINNQNSNNNNVCTNKHHPNNPTTNNDAFTYNNPYLNYNANNNLNPNRHVPVNNYYLHKNLKNILPKNQIDNDESNMFMPLTISSNSAPEQIPLCAMMRPSANHCQVLFWRPSNSPAMIVVPPKELYTVSQKLVIFSGKAVMHRKDKSKYVTSISKDTLQRMKKDKIKKQLQNKQQKNSMILGLM